MPRHRKERVSRYRALRLTDVSARRARLDAAQAQVGPDADEPSGPAGFAADAESAGAGQPASAALPAEDAAGTEPLAAIAVDGPEVAGAQSGSAAQGMRPWDRPSHRAPSPSRPRDRVRGPGPFMAAARDPADVAQAQRQGVIRGATRGLLVTPWFAAGMGFLLAAGLWIYSPHASLKLTTPVLKSPCLEQGCQSHIGGGSLATKLPGKRISTGHAHGAAKATGGENRKHKALGVTLKYSPVWPGPGGFSAVITITSKHPLGSWRLSFEMPGAQITQVGGAAWTPLPAADGGTLTPYRGRAAQPGPGGSLPGVNANAAAADKGAGEVKIWITGTGKPSTPVDCSFDGKSCSFS